MNPPVFTPGVTLSTANLITSEDPAATPKSFTIVLNEQPEEGSVVVFEISSTDTVQGGTVCDTSTFPCIVPSPIKISFTDQDWDQKQKVYLKGSDDALIDPVQV